MRKSLDFVIVLVPTAVGEWTTRFKLSGTVYVRNKQSLHWWLEVYEARTVSASFLPS